MASGNQGWQTFCVRWTRRALAAACVIICSARAEDDLADVSLWDWSLQLRGGAGYKDNLLLSDFNKESSAFTFSEAEFFVFRAPVDGLELNGFVVAEDRRFWQSPTVDKEQLLLSTADLKKQFRDIWKAGLSLQYFYNDQVFDASIVEGFPFRIPSRVHRFSGNPSLLVELPADSRLELSLGAARQNFEVPLDDSWEIGPKILFGWKFTPGSDLTLSSHWRQRAYDQRSAMPGETLRMNLWEFDAAAKHYWDKGRHWRSRLRFGAELNRDNGAAYHDYQKWRVSKDLEYTGGGWEAKLSARCLRYDYAHQLVTPSGPARRRTEVTLGWRVVREITKSTSLFLESEYEWILASDLTERYSTATIWGGIQWAPK